MIRTEHFIISIKPKLSIIRLYHYLINPPMRYSATKLLILSFLTLKPLPTYLSIRLQTLYTNHEWSYETRRAQDLPTRYMKMLSLELENILYDDMIRLMKQMSAPL